MVAKNTRCSIHLYIGYFMYLTVFDLFIVSEDLVRPLIQVLIQDG